MRSEDVTAVGSSGVGQGVRPVQTADSSPVSLVFRDLADGVRHWRIWGMLALNDVRVRYRRSKLGQFWLTLSMAVTILALGFVYSDIFQIPIQTYLPLIAVGLIVWALIAGLLNESAAVFIDSEGYIRSAALPRSVFIFRMLLRNLIAFAHNLVLVPVVWVVFGTPLAWNSLLFIPALVLTLLAGLWIAMVVGTLSARFRDLPPIVAAFTQIAFFVSPILWTENALRGRMQALQDWNPFAAFVLILREPLLGLPPTPAAWYLAVALNLFGGGVAIVFFARFRARVAYYL
ncbi:ABC transporter permease [uncultured Enterovirga sp.]|uniref:ABC transporter permease n=1 Tax=uncultured Enterovirga sp. TaxID=2026352 RepID=UPI0035CADFE0